jgi:hypothetical protein
VRIERKGELMKAYVLLQPADRPRDPPTVVLIGDYDVQQLEWANDERLLIWVLIHKNLDGTPTGQRYGDLFFPSPRSGFCRSAWTARNPPSCSAASMEPCHAPPTWPPSSTCWSTTPRTC